MLSKISIFAIAVVTFNLVGCASLTQRQTASWPWVEEDGSFKLCNKGASCTDQDALRAFEMASKFCRNVHNFYESRGQAGLGAKASIGILGTLAGAVAAPLANGSATKAWAGLSGASNAMQTQMDDALSNALSLKRQAAIADAVKEGASEFDGIQNSPAKQVIAAMMMSNGCWLAAGKADQAAIQALTGGVAKEKETPEKKEKEPEKEK